jgi:protein-disulfide isomerase
MKAPSSTRLVGAVFAGAALLAAALVSASLLGSRGDAEPAPAVNGALAGAAEAGVLLRGIPQDGIALGVPDAPVTLVEYADLQCPYCAVWARGALPAIVDRYVRSGRVRLVFRGLAFIGPDSELALRTALAAGGQGRLWNVVHLLYANQGPENGGWVTDDLLRRVGSTAGLDPDRLLVLRDSERVDRELLAAQRAADTAGIRGTPSFQAGPTGGRLEPLPVTSLGPEEIAARLDELLRG